MENSADPDQMALSEVSWSGSTMLSGPSRTRVMFLNDTILYNCAHSHVSLFW